MFEGGAGGPCVSPPRFIGGGGGELISRTGFRPPFRLEPGPRFIFFSDPFLFLFDSLIAICSCRLIAPPIGRREFAPVRPRPLLCPPGEGRGLGPFVFFSLFPERIDANNAPRLPCPPPPVATEGGGAKEGGGASDVGGVKDGGGGADSAEGGRGGLTFAVTREIGGGGT